MFFSSNLFVFVSNWKKSAQESVVESKFHWETFWLSVSFDNLLVLSLTMLSLFLISWIFLVTLFRVGFSMQSLPYGSQFSPTWNLGSLLGLS